MVSEIYASELCVFCACVKSQLLGMISEILLPFISTRSVVLYILVHRKRKFFHAVHGNSRVFFRYQYTIFDYDDILILSLIKYQLLPGK